MPTMRRGHAALKSLTCAAGFECCRWQTQGRKTTCAAGCFPPKTRVGARAYTRANRRWREGRGYTGKAAMHMRLWNQGERKQGQQMLQCALEYCCAASKYLASDEDGHKGLEVADAAAAAATNRQKIRETTKKDVSKTKKHVSKVDEMSVQHTCSADAGPLPTGSK
jgi:hypothetical protein